MPSVVSEQVVVRTIKQNRAARGRRQSNYGVSIYQDAPQMVQRKRKATEISIFSTGSYPLVEAQQQGMMSNYDNPNALTSSKPSFPTNNNLPLAPALRATTSGLIDALLEFDERLQPVPMWRTLSRGALPTEDALPPAPALWPTISGLEEAFDAQVQPQRHLTDLPPAPAFRPTISGIAEVLDMEGKTERLPMRRTRSQGATDVQRGLPMQQSVSGILSAFIDDPGSESSDWSQMF